MAERKRHPASDRTASTGGRKRRHLRLADAEAPPDGNLQARLVAAWAESIAARGYVRTTVRHIIALAHISRSTFYGAFKGKDDAFISIHRTTLDAFGRRVEHAAEGAPDWPSKIAVGMAAALEALARNSEQAQVLLGDPFAGPRLGYCHDLLVERFAPCLAAGREQSNGPLPPPSLEIGLLGSVVEIANRRLRAGEAHALPDLAPSLTEFVLTHYVGAEQAERTARYPAAPVRRLGEG